MTATRNVRQVAHWRLRPEFWDSWCRVRLPALNQTVMMDTQIYPPIPGILPSYCLVLEDRCEKEQFRKWVFTLSAEDQELVRQAIILERIS